MYTFQSYIINGDTMGADITSATVDVAQFPNANLQFWTTTATDHVGTLQVDASNDGTHWTTVPISIVSSDGSSTTQSYTAAVASGSALNLVISLEGLTAPKFRVFYDRTSGGTTAKLYALVAKKVG